MMFAFEPYHDALIRKLDALSASETRYPYVLQAYAELARTAKVPKESRKGVRAAFERHIVKTAGRLVANIAELHINNALVRECESVVRAMDKQDEEDARRELRAKEA